MQRFDPRTSSLLLVDLQRRILGLPLAPNSGDAVLAVGARRAKCFGAAGAAVVRTNVTWAGNFADDPQQASADACFITAEIVVNGGGTLL
jgi:hypothetical protein